MAEINKVQIHLLDLLYRRDVLNESMLITTELFELEEKDAILKIRELVYYIDGLKDLDLLEVKDPYYDASDSVSLEYLNNAVELYDYRIKISNLGIEYIERIRSRGWAAFNKRIIKTSNHLFYNHPLRIIIGFVLSFLLGVFCSLLLEF